eukprot:754578-Hanusia_phi.AAC.4
MLFASSMLQNMMQVETSLKYLFVMFLNNSSFALLKTILLCALLESHPEFREALQQLWTRMMTTVGLEGLKFPMTLDLQVKNSELLARLSLLLVPQWLNVLSSARGTFFKPDQVDMIVKSSLCKHEGEICKVQEVLEAFKIFSQSSETPQNVQTKTGSKKRARV